MRRTAIVLTVLVLILSGCRSSRPPDFRTAPASRTPGPGDAVVRVADLAMVEGLEPIRLTGCGVLSGLAGSGGSPADSDRQPVGFSGPWNAVSVVVTADLPPFRKVGDVVDVDLRILGRATPLRGASLLATSLRDPRKRVCAVARGPVLDSGKGRGGVPGGARIRVEHRPDILKTAPDGRRYVTLLLKNPCERLAETVADSINRSLFCVKDLDGPTETSLVVAFPRGRERVDVHLPDPDVWRKVLWIPCPPMDLHPEVFVESVMQVRISATARR